MRKFLTIAFLVSSLAVWAGEKVTDVFTLDHQMSQMCEKKIKSNLRFEKGISKIETSLKDNTITITFDKEKTNPEMILQGFKKIGFNAFLVNPVDNNKEKSEDIE
ncbi:MAG: heavy-metal-associated domain-containing protein [Muribaculaceae bacterium]|nr:heavy-metal-associated domain-containing protein [Muribaculaceae bacterium]